MPTHPIRRANSLLVALTLAVFVVFPAVALESVDIQSATAHVDYEVFVDPSPSPVCWNYWDWSVSGSVVAPFHEDYSLDEEECRSSWSLHCGTDYMSWSGAWAEVEPEHPWWNWLNFDAGLAGRVYFSEPIRLLASRSVAGQLHTDIHTVMVTPSSGEPISLLGENTGPDEAELELDEGLYVLSIYVSAREHNSHYAYDGSVLLTWEPRDEIPVQPTSWAALKALFS